MYKHYKSSLIKAAKDLKLMSSDKPYINMTLNNMLDAISREMAIFALREQISDKKHKLYIKWLDNLVCKLQAK